VDETATGSANFFALGSPDVHLRPPSIDRGVTSFLWAFGLGLFIWLGLVAVGVSRGTAFVLALISFGGIFLFVRTHGEDV
jgi:hypothetical protein